MTQQKKTPSDLEEQIQSLAGDIYVQIEDKVSAFIANYSATTEITNDAVKDHATYQALKNEFDHIKVSSLGDSAKLEKTITTLKEQLASRDELIKNSEQLNTVKLTNTESKFKDKLDELSKVSKSLNKLTIENEAKTQNLNDSIQTVKSLNEKITQLKNTMGNLAENDKTKAATLIAQDNQISELTLQLNNSTSELTFLKAELNKQSESTNKQLSAEQNAAKQYQSDIISLKQVVNGLEQQLTKEKTSNTSLENQSVALHQNVDTLNKELITVREALNSFEQSVAKEQLSAKGLVEQKDELKKSLATKDTALVQLEKNTNKLQQSLNSATDKVLLLETSLVNEKQTNSQLNKDITELTKQLDQSKESLTNEQKNTIKIQSELTELNNCVDGLNIKISESEKQIKNTEAMLESLRKVKDGIQSKHLLEIDSLKQSIDKHRTEMELLVKDNDQYKIHIDTLNASLNTVDKNHKEQIILLADTEKNHTLAIELLNKNLVKEQSLTKALEGKNTDNIKALKSAEKALSEHKVEVKQFNEKIAQAESELTTLRVSHDELLTRYEKINKSAELYEKDLVKLKDKYDSDKQKYADIQSRVEATKTKQEIEYNKARDTIKYLRDENLDLNTKLDQQVSELEDKIREYRLRFEYAQKQLNTLQ